MKNHTVWINSTACVDVVWASDRAVACTVAGVFAVGNYRVTLRVNGVGTAPSAAATLRFECGPGYYGNDGQACVPCPEGAECSGGFAPPVALVGYFPEAAGLFVLCSPPEACLGGENGTCSKLYTGPRCANCALGAYRYVCGLISDS